MLTLNEIVTSICKLHSLNINWDCVRHLVSEKDIHSILSTDIPFKDIKMGEQYQCTLVSEFLFHWQKDLTQNDVHFIEELLPMFKELHISLKDINKTNLKCIVTVDFKNVYRLNSTIFSLTFTKNLLVNLLVLNIPKTLFKELFFSLYPKCEKNLDFNFLRVIPIESLRYIKYLKYFPIENSEDFPKWLEILQMERNIKFFEYILYKQYLSSFNSSIDDYLREFYKVCDRLNIIYDLEDILTYSTLKKVMISLNNVTFSYKRMATLLYSLKNKCSISTDYTEVQIYSLMLNSKYHSLLNLKSSQKIVNLILYCINHHKWAFLKLLNDNFEWLNSRNDNALIFNSAFWNLVNLNSLNLNDLNKTALPFSRDILDMLKSTDIKNLSFQEFTFFCSLSYKVAKYLLIIFNNLLLNSDRKLVILKELKNIDDVSYILYDCLDNDTDFKQLSSNLSIKPLSCWMSEFLYIKDINKKLCLKILSFKDWLSPYLKDISNRNELEFIINNISDESFFDLSLDSIRNRIIFENKIIYELFDLLNLSESFIERNKANIAAFCLKGLPKKTLTYYKTMPLSSQQKKDFLLLVRLELCDHIQKIKYASINFARELEIGIDDISLQQRKMWMKNISFSKDESEIKEYDTFAIYFKGNLASSIEKYSNRYFLSFLDSTYKKIYYIEKGIIKGEAVLRLTKTLDSYSTSEAIEETSQNSNLSLFLEKPIISPSCLNPKEFFEKLVKLALEKSKIMRIPLFLSHSYKGFIADDKNYKEFKTSIFINKSRSHDVLWSDISYAPLNTEKGTYMPIILSKYN